ncbi:MAG TPA: ECF transporter S component, partial [Firmicutes bacterium]|nr:ECF transporter S component [Bacillota bacterium]
MHLPVLICGFVCGWPYGLAVGFISPLLRTMLFGMPPFPMVAVPMAFELAAYGLLTGLLYKALPKQQPISIYLSLIGA